MQQTSLSRIIREELFRALVFGIGFLFVVASGFVSVAYAANGGMFGDILSKILASGNWESPGDGTVKNSQKLGNLPASSFVPVRSGQSCNTCIQGFQSDGSVQCAP